MIFQCSTQLPAGGDKQGKANHEPLQDKQWNDEIERTATMPEQQT
jgi:hypothetical protein